MFRSYLVLACLQCPVLHAFHSEPFRRPVSMVQQGFPELTLLGCSTFADLMFVVAQFQWLQLMLAEWSNESLHHVVVYRKTPSKSRVRYSTSWDLLLADPHAASRSFHRPTRPDSAAYPFVQSPFQIAT